MATQRSSTIAKAFELLTLFEARGSLTVGQCALRLGAPRSSVHRLLLSLEAVGAVDRTDDGHFQLGLRLLQMGSLTPLRHQVDAGARASLQLLCTETGLPVHLAARQGTRALLIEALPGARYDMPTRVGTAIPFHSTASGKVLLAHAPPEVVDAVLAGQLPRYTRFTIAEGERLRAELDSIRLSGVGVGYEETHYGVACLAAPVRAPSGAVRVAMSLAYPARARKAAIGYRQTLILARNQLEARLRAKPSRIPRRTLARRARPEKLRPGLGGGTRWRSAI